MKKELNGRNDGAAIDSLAHGAHTEEKKTLCVCVPVLFLPSSSSSTTTTTTFIPIPTTSGRGISFVL